jgi:hypothetical protein
VAENELIRFVEEVQHTARAEAVRRAVRQMKEQQATEFERLKKRAVGKK